MVKIFETRINFFILLVVVNQLFITSCSKKIHTAPSALTIINHDEKQFRKDIDEVSIERMPEKIPDLSPSGKVVSEPFQNITTPEEEKKLKHFIDKGSEKSIETQDCSPDEIIATAQKFLGIPYCMGGTTIKCMDCSGLLAAVFAKNGIRLPHSSEEQARYGKIIPTIDELIKGDLVFFIRSYKTSRFITHAGIYIGNNEFIHSSSKKGVSISSLNYIWWSKKFIFGTRLL